MPVTINSITAQQRINVTGDPTVAGAVPCTMNPGDTVYREDTGTEYIMTAAGLVAGSSLDESPVFTSVTVSGLSALASVTASTTAVITGKLTVTGTVTAAGAVADGTALTVTPTAAANNDVLSGLKVSVAAGTPGAFTGLVRQGISVPAFTVVGDTSPGNPVGISVGIITGTGATVASALSLAPPTGATTNYLIRHTTAATFNVTGAGALTAASGVFVGGFGCNGAAIQTAVTVGAALAAYATGAFGLDSDANMSALHADVVAIRAALVANGIMAA